MKKIFYSIWKHAILMRQKYWKFASVSIKDVHRCSWLRYHYQVQQNYIQIIIWTFLLLIKLSQNYAPLWLVLLCLLIPEKIVHKVFYLFGCWLCRKMMANEMKWENEKKIEWLLIFLGILSQNCCRIPTFFFLKKRFCFSFLCHCCCEPCHVTLSPNFFTFIDPRGRPQSRPVVITIFTQFSSSVLPSVRPSQNFKIKGLWAGQVDHWCLLFLYLVFLFKIIMLPLPLQALRLWRRVSAVIKASKVSWHVTFKKKFCIYRKIVKLNYLQLCLVL